MDEDIIDFNNLRDHLNFATDMRKLQRERDYLEYNLDKLIFAGLKNIPKKSEICLSMDIKDTTQAGYLTNVELLYGKLVIDYPISEKRFNRLILPVYRVQADIEMIGFENYPGYLNGVIRPYVDKVFERVYMDKPEFHFYIEDPRGDIFMGKTFMIEKKTLTTIMRDWDRDDFEKINSAFLNTPKKLLHSWFEVLIKPEGAYMVKFNRK